MGGKGEFKKLNKKKSKIWKTTELIVNDDQTACSKSNRKSKRSRSEDSNGSIKGTETTTLEVSKKKKLSKTDYLNYENPLDAKSGSFKKFRSDDYSTGDTTETRTTLPVSKKKKYSKAGDLNPENPLDAGSTSLKKLRPEDDSTRDTIESRTETRTTLPVSKKKKKKPSKAGYLNYENPLDAESGSSKKFRSDDDSIRDTTESGTETSTTLPVSKKKKHSKAGDLYSENPLNVGSTSLKKLRPEDDSIRSPTQLEMDPETIIEVLKKHSKTGGGHRAVYLDSENQVNAGPMSSSSINKYGCPDCSFVSDRLSRLLRHRRKHDPTITMFRCPLCPEPFASHGALNRHKASTHTTYGCRHCEFETGSTEVYWQHIRSFHRFVDSGELPAPRTYVPTQDDNYPKRPSSQHDVASVIRRCKACKTAFLSAELQAAHLCPGVAGPRTAYVCPHCPYKSLRRSRYLVHFAKHDSSVKTFRCKICRVPYASAKTLRRHVKSHSPYECRRCPFVAEIYIDFYRHTLEHLKEGHSDVVGMEELPKERTVRTRNFEW